jgi:hypothetical protein
MANLWELAKTLAAIAILGAIFWAAYSVWNSSPSGANETVAGASFNCRRALADEATGYPCMNSKSCSMSDDEVAELKQLQASINKYCD